MNILPLNNSVDKLGSASAQWAELNVLVVNINGTPAAKTTRALDTFGVTTDITDLDATTSKHGLMPKLDKVKLDTIETSATADQTNAEIETAYNAQVSQVSGPEITAGTATGIRRYSPADIKAIVDAHAPTALDAADVVAAISAATNATDTVIKTLTTGVLTYDLRLKTSGLTSGAQGEISKDSSGAFILLGTGANVAAAGNDARFLTTDQNAAIAASDAPAAGNPVMTLSGAKAIAIDEFAAATDNTNLDATTLKHGLMSKADKVIVSAIETRALDTFGATTDITALDATTSKHGLMSKADKIKLDSVAASDAEIETAYNTQVAQVSAGEIIAGSSTSIRRYSPANIKAFIDAHAVSAGATWNTAKGTAIASATTIDLGTTTGNIVDITGTTTIASLGTANAGLTRMVRFTGALQITHNATTLINLTGANITTAAGDVAAFSSLGSGNWHMVFYQRASGAPLVSTSLASPGVIGNTTPSSATFTELLANTQFRLPIYTLATLPAASGYPGYQISVQDASADSGAAHINHEPAFSDNTNWRYVSDGAVVTP